jgi:hypothetical protein
VQVEAFLRGQREEFQAVQPPVPQARQRTDAQRIARLKGGEHLCHRAATPRDTTRDGVCDTLDLASLLPMGEQPHIGLVFRHLLLVCRDAQGGNRAGGGRAIGRP